MKQRSKRDGWFAIRGYPHLDRPLDFARAKALVTNPDAVAKHGFLPLISYTESKRQFRTDNSDRTIPKKKRARISVVKHRDIKYAGHADAAIFSYYAHVLQGHYEHWLVENGLSENVIGYRSGLGSNVDMAAEVFAEVSTRRTTTALCFDI